MKSLKDYSLDISEQEYHDYPAWSHSLIARYAKDGFGAIKNLHEPIASTPSLEFGSLFDTIITSDDFDSQYVISDSCPPPAEKKVLDTLLTMTSAPFYEIPTPTMEEAISTCQYQQRWSYGKQYEHIEENKDYYENRRTGKKVKSTEDYNDAMKMADELHNQEYSTGKLFKKGTVDGVEYIYQAKFVTKYNTGFNEIVDIKIMPDLLIVNHNDKTIQPVDLKTSQMPAYDFTENFIKFRYDIQACMYSDVIRAVMRRDHDYDDYTILPYIFSDISRSDMVPVSWVYNQFDPSQIDGFKFKDYQFKSWKTLLNEILEYEKSNAIVPSYIKTDVPNDILAYLNNR